MAASGPLTPDLPPSNPCPATAQRGSIRPIRGMTGRSTPRPKSAARTRRLGLWIPALGRSFGAPMVYRTISVPENGSIALAVRSDSCCRRALHGIHGVVYRMQCSTCPFDRFGRNRPFRGLTGMHGPADAAWNKQPGEETHLYPIRRNGPTRRLLSLRTPPA
jgi:hypothetical protein